MEKLIIAFLYMLLMLVFGFLGYKKVNSFADYSVAGRAIPFWRNVHSISASAIGAGATMGTASIVYTHGISGLWLGIGASSGLFLCGLFLAKRLREEGNVTVPDIMTKKFGKTIGDWITFLNMFALIAILSGQLRALGTITQTFIKVSLLEACVIMGAVTITYTVLGGLFAATYTDAVNMMIMIVSVMVILPMTSLRHTGFEVLSKTLDARYFNPLGMGVLAILGILMWIVPTNFVSQENFLRICGAKNAREARAATMTSSLLVYFPYFVFCGIIGLSGAALFPGLKNPDAIFPLMIDKLTSPILGGFLLSGLLAAVVSTTGSILLIISVNVSNNIVKRIVPGITEKKRISVSRWSVVLVGVVGIVIGNYANSIISVMQDVSAPYISAILPLIITAFFWKKANLSRSESDHRGGRCHIHDLVGVEAAFWNSPHRVFACLFDSDDGRREHRRLA